MLWQALEKLVDEGKIKSIGVSNTGKGLIDGMKQYAKIWPPSVNQIEVHFAFPFIASPASVGSETDAMFAWIKATSMDPAEGGC